MYWKMLSLIKKLKKWWKNENKLENGSSDILSRKQIGKVMIKGAPFKNDGKCFLFHLESSFRSQDI